LLPGVPQPADLLETILDRFQGPECFLLHREDLPDAMKMGTGLREIYGAEYGDHVLEVGPPRQMQVASTRWSIVMPDVSELPKAQ
ncbi:MAG: hypothetical protein ACRCZF_00890, partial [Gemmataceae bacterium]